MESATPPTPKGRVSVAKITMIVYNEGGSIIKGWHKGVKVDDNTIEQLKKIAQLPFIYKWVASMPDAHFGCGSAVGTVMATQGAICPATCGVDIGCGMIAVNTGLKRSDFGDNLGYLRERIEKAVPNGRS